MREIAYFSPGGGEIRESIARNLPSLGNSVEKSSVVIEIFFLEQNGKFIETVLIYPLIYSRGQWNTFQIACKNIPLRDRRSQANIIISIARSNKIVYFGDQISSYCL